MPQPDTIQSPADLLLYPRIKMLAAIGMFWKCKNTYAQCAMFELICRATCKKAWTTFEKGTAWFLMIKMIVPEQYNIIPHGATKPKLCKLMVHTCLSQRYKRSQQVSNSARCSRLWRKDHEGLASPEVNTRHLSKDFSYQMLTKI